MSLLKISHLGAQLGGRTVLSDVSLDVAAGEFVGLIGPNGAGKTTLLRAVLGLTAYTGGIALANSAVETLSARDKALRVSYLPQEREIAWPVTVERVVALGRAPHLPPFSRPGVADAASITRAMARMDILDLATRAATDLSGGEKARVLIARALAQEAPLLLADEPTSGLDPSHQIALMKVFAELARDGAGVVACLHDLGLAARWCTRLILLDQGRIVADGTPREVLSAERLRAIYNIRAFIREDADGVIVHPLDLASDDETRN
jgi:iron complex transport system ATP-binding protein